MGLYVGYYLVGVIEGLRRSRRDSRLRAPAICRLLHQRAQGSSRSHATPAIDQAELEAPTPDSYEAMNAGAAGAVRPALRLRLTAARPMTRLGAAAGRSSAQALGPHPRRRADHARLRRAAAAPACSSSTPWKTPSRCRPSCSGELGQRLGAVALNRYPASAWRDLRSVPWRAHVGCRTGAS